MSGHKKLKLTRETLTSLDPVHVEGGIPTTSGYTCVPTQGCSNTCARTRCQVCAITLTNDPNCTVTRDQSLGIVVCNTNSGALVENN
jgi:hypothetical protein